MNSFKNLLILLILLAGTSSLQAQVIGEWTDYQSYASAKNVVDAGDMVYCVTEGGLFSYSKTDNSIQKMSGINGLSDVGVQRLAYSKENGLLLIAYKNANIDLSIGNTIFNLSDIKRKQISADKTINSIMFSGKLAYLSCGFGIVVINLERKEVKDTYIIGDEGNYLNVLDIATDGNFLYAATADGIYKASVSDPNLQNYNNWVKQTNIPTTTKQFNQIEYYNSRIIANGDKLYQLGSTGWEAILPGIVDIKEASVTGNYLVLTCSGNVLVYNSNLELAANINKYSLSGVEKNNISPQSATIDAQNTIWIADKNYGLIKIGTQHERIVPQGPVDNKIFSMTINEQDLWIASGGRSEDWNNIWTSPKFQLQRNGNWSAYDSSLFPNTNNFSDIVCVTVDPSDPDHVFAGSWGGGILEFKAGKFVKRYDNYNSTLATQLPEQPAEPFVRIGGMDFDSKGNLWVSNTGVAKVVSVLKTDGNWEAFQLSGLANKYTGKLVVTQNDDKWVLAPRGNGLYALNSTNTTSKAQSVIARFANSDGEYFTDMNELYSMAEDLNGQLWVGTSAGIAVFSNPANIWKDATMYATRPALDLKDGKFHPLLDTETITAIAVDGANRKWIGTRSSGIFLVSENGDEELQHFTSENSPLLNNEITDIAISQKTGEVFIGTISGLISYMGEATEANDVFSDVYVYPNPVRETFDGDIVIKGLVDDTDVKITDISGNLVYKTTSLGGQAIWDGKNLNGKRCMTGIYLVFLSDATGEQTKITKLMFIH